ncbi:hypothetical protein HK097_008712, partial [Rhizophlyctis rosea]
MAQPNTLFVNEQAIPANLENYLDDVKVKLNMMWEYDIYLDKLYYLLLLCETDEESYNYSDSVKRALSWLRGRHIDAEHQITSKEPRTYRLSQKLFVHILPFKTCCEQISDSLKDYLSAGAISARDNRDTSTVNCSSYMLLDGTRFTKEMRRCLLTQHKEIKRQTSSNTVPPNGATNQSNSSTSANPTTAPLTSGASSAAQDDQSLNTNGEGGRTEGEGVDRGRVKAKKPSVPPLAKIYKYIKDRDADAGSDEEEESDADATTEDTAAKKAPKDRDADAGSNEEEKSGTDATDEDTAGKKASKEKEPDAGSNEEEKSDTDATDEDVAVDSGKFKTTGKTKAIAAKKERQEKAAGAGKAAGRKRVFAGSGTKLDGCGGVGGLPVDNGGPSNLPTDYGPSKSPTTPPSSKKRKDMSDDESSDDDPHFTKISRMLDYSAVDVDAMLVGGGKRRSFSMMGGGGGVGLKNPFDNLARPTSSSQGAGTLTATAPVGFGTGMGLTLAGSLAGFGNGVLGSLAGPSTVGFGSGRPTPFPAWVPPGIPPTVGGMIVRPTFGGGPGGTAPTFVRPPSGGGFARPQYVQGISRYRPPPPPP